jgi:NAD(P)-dependent dehydrogenase (short-subunit alcohol dehydrogenase family)
VSGDVTCHWRRQEQRRIDNLVSFAKAAERDLFNEVLRHFLRHAFAHSYIDESRRNGGRVINMSSVSGQMGLFGQANYSSSKAAIIALTKVSAREFARQNITVNSIAPGFIDVGMSKGMSEEVTQNFIKQIPLGRLGEAREIVDAALFLASPMASYITGHVLNVNGGFYMG